ncbi:hypothetical protein HFO69_26855 [Rhizobium laguerreae]|uniref:hypothetical protein n=1 Tax=Rhizobium laguerreae TaxID=1076926 RepID=UPI001C925B85|nr:hypothetical protein [Rhizobium laguerreae]MBY3101286.1 hypothetical protein [Rhizobium laguerreae]
MTEIENLKGAVRARLRRDFNQVRSARDTSRKAHLEVWESKRGGRVIGVEFDHADRLNFWLTRLGMPRDLPSTIERTDKDPNGRGWTDANGDGANSNLSGYKQFVTRPIARLGVKAIDDAVLVLEHLCR